MSTTRALEQIFDKLSGTTKWQVIFFIEVFNLIYSIQGRFNFQNLCCYSEMGKALKGLEISLVSLIDVRTRKAWALDVVQTPSDLSQKENDMTRTRIDFYMDQIRKCQGKLLKTNYFVGDGFYAKTKVFKAMSEMNKHFITKLRPNANLRYLFNGKHPKRKGRKSRYAGKIDFYQLQS